MMEIDVEALLASMTLEEKASLCSGRDYWNTKAVERLGLPSWTMTDGPHGLRKACARDDAVGLAHSVPATCFPPGAGLAASWDPDLVGEVAEALAREAGAADVGVLLGPAVNIKRSPLCGRNFEYFSEDPQLAGELAVRYIRGLQSGGVGASIKHFAANNQETRRMLVDAVVDERALREIYLPAFERAVKEADPWTLMCSYNKVNGVYASQDPWLLTQVLRKEWGYEGVVVTDWGACDDRVAGLAAGQDLEMPGSGGRTDAEIVAAVRDGSLDEAVLDQAALRLLRLAAKVLGARREGAAFDADAHHALARRAARDSMVLLKNEGGLLPLRDRSRIAFLGAFARVPRYQGGGSSHINPTRMDDAFEEAAKLAPSGCSLSYAPGYPRRPGAVDPLLIAEAREAAARAEVAVLFAGLTEDMESEGFDRKDLRLPPSHEALIEAVLEVQPNLVVVLSNGAPVEMPWAGRVPAILEGYLGGQAWGGAVADLLFGLASPSGKLAETFPKRLEDNPTWIDFPGEGRRVEYREGLFVGYRHYDAARIEPLFPFGHGLSYARFEYSNLRLDKAAMRDDERLRVLVEVGNVGELEAKEIAQLYVGGLKPAVPRPLRELKAFAKVSLRPGETKTLSFELGKRAFAHWNGERGGWTVETGDYELSVGASSRDLRLRARVRVESTAESRRVWDFNAGLGELAAEPRTAVRVGAMMRAMAGALGCCEPGSPEALMIEKMIEEMPLRAAVRLSAGGLSWDTAAALLEELNGI